MRALRALAVAAAWGLALLPLYSEAQQPVHRIGVLMGVGPLPAPMLEGLRERGWVVGGNLRIEYRYHQERGERTSALAAELAELVPEVIVAVAPLPALAVRAVAPTIPLVFVNVTDPVG